MIPEPFSVTTGVLGIIGFLNLARQGAEASHTDIKTYRDAPKDVLSFYKDAKLAEYRMSLWKRIWSIQPDTHQEYPHDLWGDGWEHIKHQIDSIEELSRTVDDCLLPYVREYVAGNFWGVSALSKASNLGAQEARRIAQRKHDADKINSELWWGKKIAYVLSKSKNLKEDLKKYGDLFESLYRVSEDVFFEKHGDKEKNISNQTRRDIAMGEMLVHQAKKTRGPSWALHQSCRSAGEGPIELELSMLRWKVGVDNPRPFHAGIPERLCYFLTVPSRTLTSVLYNSANGPDHAQYEADPPEKLGMLVEYWKTPLPDCKTSFRNICAALMKDDASFLSLAANAVAGQSQSHSFKFSKASGPVVDQNWQESTLADLLASSATRARDNDLSLRERVETAYRVAECFFLLLGTSWLSDLKTSNITRACRPGSPSRYRVLIGPALGKRDGYFDLQTKRLGQLLRELALGVDVGTSYDKKREPPLLARELGEPYQLAIDFCYEEPKSNIPPALITQQEYDTYYLGILANFLNRVVFPLARLHESNKPVDPFASKRDHTLSFSPKMYPESPPLPLAGSIPTLCIPVGASTSLLGMLGTTIKALSIRSSSTLGNFGKSDVIIYNISKQEFSTISREDLPQHAHRLEIPRKGMVYEIELPLPNSDEKKAVGTVKFGELGFRTAAKRLRGLISEVFIVDDIFGKVGLWDQMEEVEDD